MGKMEREAKKDPKVLKLYSFLISEVTFQNPGHLDATSIIKSVQHHKRIGLAVPILFRGESNDLIFCSTLFVLPKQL